jgi:hypothetical protein
MAKIKLPPQSIDLLALVSQFPGPPFNNTKFFFQLELREVTFWGNLIFGVIAYPAWRKGNSPRERWIIGSKVTGSDTGAPDIVPVDPLGVAFGNNEILLWHPEKGISEQEAQHEKFIYLYNKIIENKELLAKSVLTTGNVRLSKNPHLYYDVTLSSGGTSETALTNPCPPNQPGE